MPELNALPPIVPADVSNDDLLLIYDNSAATLKARKVTRSDFLKDVPREGGDHDFGTSDFETLTATDATSVNHTITTSLTFEGAATIASVRNVVTSVAVPSISSGLSETVTLTLSGIASGDYVNLSFLGPVSEGLIFQAWVSAADTISIRFFNADSGAFSGASYDIQIMAIRFS